MTLFVNLQLAQYDLWYSYFIHANLYAKISTGIYHNLCSKLYAVWMHIYICVLIISKFLFCQEWY